MGERQLAKQHIKRGLWLTKDNKLIVMEAVMNPLEYKVMNYFMIRAVECGQLKGIQVRASDLIKDTNLKKTGYTDVLRKLTKTIVKTSIHIEEPSVGNKKHWTDMALIPKMDYDDGILTCDFNDELRPYIFGELQSFTKSQYAYIASCRTYSAMRMYEICNSWRKTTRVAYYDLPKWRAILGAMGKSYLKFPHFRQRILESAIKEVSEKTDLMIKPEYIKTGRAITHIKMHIFPKSESQNVLFETEPQKKVAPVIAEMPVEASQEPQGRPKTEKRTPTKGMAPKELLDVLTDQEIDCMEKMKKKYKLSEKLAAEYLLNYGILYCQEQMEYTRQQHSAGNVRNIGGYLREAIEQDYAGSKHVQKQARQAESDEHQDKMAWNLSAVGIDPVAMKQPVEALRPQGKTEDDGETDIRREQDKEAQELWNKILNLSKSPIYKHLMDLTGISPFLPRVVAYKTNATELYLEVSNNFVKEWFDEHYSTKLNALASIVNGHETVVKVNAPE